MRQTRLTSSTWALTVALLLTPPLSAQTPETAPGPTTDAVPAAAAGAPTDALPSVPLNGTVVTGTEASPAPTPEPPPPPPAPLTCRQITERANAADLKAANAQSAKEPATRIAERLDEAIQWWAQAVETCEGRSRDRAERNLADSKRGRDSLQGQLGADPECLASQKDATQLQDLAQQAVRERRWLDASVLFRKAENLWDEASEVCSGELQSTATQRRDQTAQDGYNAEFCAPLFERAREYATLIRRQPGTQTTEKQTQSLAAETLWREAEQQCKGNAQSIARTNAQNLGKERGTPWVTTALPAGVQLATAKPTLAAAAAPVAAKTAPPPKANNAKTGPQTPATEAPPQKLAAVVTPSAAVPSAAPTVAAATLQATGTAATHTQAAADAATTGTSTVGSALKFLSGLLPTPASAAAAPETAPPVAPPPAQPRTIDETIAGVRFQGTFVNTNGVLTGQGTVQWPSGDSYQGSVENHQPHGQGTYQWASGQTYQGEWVQGQPHGTGRMKFANGNVYEGALVNGTPQGRGTMTYAWGDRYEGDFGGGIPDGSGHYRWKNGDQYTGEWKAGQKHGTGTLEWASGDKWAGRYESDQQTTGTLTRKAP